MARLSRRSFLTGSAAVASGAVASGLLPGATPTAAAATRTGTIADVKHVVVLMQENRSFDHYYGMLGGVAGLGDRRVLEYPGGAGSVFTQPDPTHRDRVLLPWHLDTSKFNAQEAGDLDHSWDGTHEAWDGGAWDRWIAAKGEETMGYFARADLPWQYALADSFTICDQYFCSIQGPTTPNRLFHWTGTIDPHGVAGGPAISNPADYQPVYRWTTYPERLQAAGVSWRVFANDEVGDGDDGYVGDYGDNPLWLFQAYHDALASSDPKQQQLARRASLRTRWKPDSGLGRDVDHVLTEFIDACAAGTLPTVSWVVAPYAYSEHPQARPVDGAHYTQRVLQALWDNPGLWESTAVFVNFDENDGFFDHVPPPTPPAGTADEFVDGLPVGLGPRVPMMVISPWSRGGWVNSQVADHTSVLRFLEVWTGVREPNISAWRRAVCSDLTSCFDFGSFDPSIPTLPDTEDLVRIADEEESLPPVTPPTGRQTPPKPEFATRGQRPLPYAGTAELTVDRRTGKVTVTAANTGAVAMALAAYDGTAVPFAATSLLVRPGHTATWSPASVTGPYDVQVLGPHGFLRAFRGTVVPAGPTTRQVPRVTTQLVPGHHAAIVLALHNDGRADVRFTVTPNDFSSAPARSVVVKGGRSTQVTWPARNGWYDVTVSADTVSAFAYRYAGKIES